MTTASLGERLLAGREKLQAAQGEYVGTIDCGGGTLRVHYRALSYREDRKVGQRHEGVRDEVEKEIRLAADTLVTASVKTEAEIDGEVHELPPLGLGLTTALGLDEPETDIQAALLLFPSERALIQQFVAYEQWATEVAQTVDGEIEENSGAATG